MKSDAPKASHEVIVRDAEFVNDAPNIPRPSSAPDTDPNMDPSIFESVADFLDDLSEPVSAVSTDAGLRLVKGGNVARGVGRAAKSGRKVVLEVEKKAQSFKDRFGHLVTGHERPIMPRK